MLLEVSFDRSESQNPPRTNPLVSVPRTPKKRTVTLNGNKDMGAEGVKPADVVIASLLSMSVWSFVDISSAQSTVDAISIPSAERQQWKTVCCYCVLYIVSNRLIPLVRN